MSAWRKFWRAVFDPFTNRELREALEAQERATANLCKVYGIDR